MDRQEEKGYILGIDYGEKRLGLALAHTIARIPRAFKTIENSPVLLKDLKEVIQSEEVSLIVVGLPRNQDGSLGGQAEACLKFARELKKEVILPVVMAEEFLSSIESVKENVPKKASNPGLDAHAAATILDRYFIEGEVEGVNL